MRNTYIPLDILYLRPTAGAFHRPQHPAASEAPIPSNGPVNAVLEINGGLAERLGILPGDQVGTAPFLAPEPPIG
jgi:uncharacterized membrane protein (UPF0127 family)